MTSEEELREKILKAAFNAIERGTDARSKRSGMSIFFTYFLAMDNRKLSPFAGIVDSNYIDDDEVALRDVPRESADTKQNYARVLQELFDGIHNTCPLSRLNEPFHIQLQLDWPFDDILKYAKAETERCYRGLKIDAIEDGLVASLRIRANASKKYAEVFYHMLLVLEAFERSDLVMAGALAGLLSPTVNIVDWKKDIVQRVLSGDAHG
jgi:hypothetical protein